MKVIFLDDSEARQRTMKSVLPCIVQTYTADETIEAIKSSDKIDYLFLDHDLGGQVYVDSSEHNTGMTVAKWIVEHEEEIDIGYVILHSFNPAGAKNMAQELEGVFNFGISPFMSVSFGDFVNKVVDSQEEETLGCPWCGAQPEIKETLYEEGKFLAECSNTDCPSWAIDTKEEIIKAWNTRYVKEEGSK
jgi:hypothetical protein